MADSIEDTSFFSENSWSADEATTAHGGQRPIAESAGEELAQPA